MLDIPAGLTKCGIRDLGFAGSDKVNHHYVCFVTYSSETAVPPLYPVNSDQALSVTHSKSSIVPLSYFSNLYILVQPLIFFINMLLLLL